MTTMEPEGVVVVQPPDNSQLAELVAWSLLHVPVVGTLPEGRFQLINVRTGRPQIDQPLPAVAVPKSIYALESDNELFLLVNGQMRQQPSQPIGLDYPLVDGQVYAFDRRDGRMIWPRPAIIQRRGLSLTQPPGIPLLVFVDRELRRDANGSGSKLRLLCMDKQTGATLYRHDELPDTAVGQFGIRATRGEPRIVSVETSAWTIRLAYSDRPRPPQPPANDAVEAPRTSRGEGLMGVGRRMGEMIQGVIQDPRGRNWRPPASQGPGGNHENANQPAIDDD
jgi:hypothetical protein